jgi:hypothetical protein
MADVLLKADEIAAVTNRDLPTSVAEAISVLASGAVRDHCGWRVAKTAEETFTVTSRGTRLLFLPSLHIVSVVSVTEDGETVDPSLYEWDDNGVIERTTGKWARGRRAITVTVTHGHAKCPATIARIIAASVQRGAFVPSGGITGETAIGQTIQYSRVGGMAATDAFTPDELERLEQYRIGSSR